MPQVIDPPRGYLVTANNRLAPDDYPAPLACTSTSGYRAQHIRQEIERREKLSIDDNKKLQLDVLSLRAAACVPPLLGYLKNSHNSRVKEAVRLLQDWDYRVTTSSISASLFNVFFVHWCRAVSMERLAPVGTDDQQSQDLALLAVDRLNGLAANLLVEDSVGWFQHQNRSQAITAAFESALDELADRVGGDMSAWRWGRLHTLTQPHYLSGRGDLGVLLDQSGTPMPGDGTTVCAGYPNAQWTAYLLAGNRLVADMGDPGMGLWMIDSAGTSAHVGSVHYHDQLQPWSRGEYRYLPLEISRAEAAAIETLHLSPDEQGD
jgi:penicillin amidase